MHYVQLQSRHTGNRRSMCRRLLARRKYDWSVNQSHTTEYWYRTNMRLPSLVPVTDTSCLSVYPYAIPSWSFLQA